MTALETVPYDQEETSGGMHRFSVLVNTLGTSTKTNEKLDALTGYFHEASGKDKVWVIALFSGRRPKRVVNSTLLAEWSREQASLPPWLFEESYHTVGDLAETIALILPPPDADRPEHNLSWYIGRLMELGPLPEAEKKAFILECWRGLGKEERFVFNKIITGGFRIGVSQQLMVQSLARVTGLEASIVAHRISGNWEPAVVSFGELLSGEGAAEDHSKPYPFYLAYALEGGPDSLGDPADWQAEWKWDGIRGQLIRRNGQLFVWSRGEELMTEKFPEFGPLLPLLPEGTVLDGEIMPSRAGRPLPFALLQTRIGRKNVTKKQLTEAPVAFFAYDLLEFAGNDCRNLALEERREQLEQILDTLHHPALLL